MDESSATSRAIAAAGKVARYDAHAKALMNDKQLLAFIMKELLPEYRGMTLKDVVSCIEGTPAIGEEPVFPGMGGSIVGMPTESMVPGEGTVFYDVRFYATTPDDSQVRIILNIEIQNKNDPGYKLSKRAIYYACRLVSSQLDVEFSPKNYNNIRKVYSIWLVLDPPKRLENTTKWYTLATEDESGSLRKDSEVDILNVAMLYVGKTSGEVNGPALHRMLSALFDREKGAVEKETILESEFGISMDNQGKEALDEMCNLGQGIYEQGIARGIEQGIAAGIEQGIAAGIEQGAAKSQRAMILGMHEAGIPIAVIAKVAKMSEADVHGILEAAEK